MKAAASLLAIVLLATSAPAWAGQGAGSPQGHRTGQVGAQRGTGQKLSTPATGGIGRSVAGHSDNHPGNNHGYHGGQAAKRGQ